MSNSSEFLKRRQFVAIARHSPFWGAINLVSFFLCLLDYNYTIITSALYLTLLEKLVSFFELGLMILFLVNFLYNVYLYVWIKKLMQPVELSAHEFSLYGIDSKEIGFKLKTENDKVDKLASVKNLANYPSTPSFELNTSSFIDKHSSLDSTALSNRLFDSTLDSTAASWSYLRSNDSPLLQNFPSKFNTSGSELKFRKSNSFLTNLPPNKSAISDQDDIKRYLNEQDEHTEHINELIQAQKRLSSLPDSSPMSQMNTSMYGPKGDNSINSPFTAKNQSFGSPFNKSTHSPFSGHPQLTTSNFEQQINAIRESPNYILDYQPAIKVSSLPRSPEKSESVNYSHSSTKALEKVLAKLDVDDSRLNQMVENIRKWISQTILIRIAEEIDSINMTISEKNFIDSLIGETSIQQLKQLASNKKSDFPTLEQLCTYLDIHTRNIENNITLQQYLVRRIKDLAKGGCITEFLWDGGGSYNYKHWKEEMPTDSEIILHLFCVYMDSRLLFNPTIPEGKPFTSQHFKPTAGPMPKSDTYIQQEKAYPPFFSLVLKGENFDLPPGRNNLFYALLVFLHHIKVKNFGLLGRINLGASGLNIAWVIDK